MDEAREIACCKPPRAAEGARAVLAHRAPRIGDAYRRSITSLAGAASAITVRVRSAFAAGRIVCGAAALALLCSAPGAASGASPAGLLGNGSALDGARVSSPLTLRVAAPGVSSVRYVLDGHYLGKTSTMPFSWRLTLPVGRHELKARLDGVPGSLTATFTVSRGSAVAAPKRPVVGIVQRGKDIYVRDSASLARALAAARPGQTIHLANGDYTGRTRVGDYTGSFAITRSGTSAAPITLTGGRGAVLDGGGTGGHYGLYVVGASWWRFRGFTVAHASKGVVSDRGSHNVYAGLEIRDIGAEGLHLRAFSRSNLISNCRIHATGEKQAQFGEGVYVGSANSNWSTYSDGTPDTSDGNRIVGSTIWSTGAENIDIKEGTSGGTVRGNQLDGVGMSGKNHSDSLIDVKGDRWLIIGNHGTVSGASAVVDGFQVHDVYRAWGKGNVFRGNALTFPAGIDGYGFLIQGANDVACDNDVRGASSGLASTACASG